MEKITLDNVSVVFRTSYGDVRAVDDVSEEFEKGITGIVGESGSGKSVLGLSILRLLPTQARVYGRIFYNGSPIATCEGPLRRLRGAQIALIAQNPSDSLNPVLRVGRQVYETIRAHSATGATQAEWEAQSLLRQFGFDDSRYILRRYPFELSGGMKQRIVCAIGLASHPRWIIADEPTKGLDASLREQVSGLLRQVMRADLYGMILITHDLLLAQSLCDRVFVMYAGQIVEQIDADRFLKSPRHPYTQGLVASLPQNGMQPMDGMSPDIREMPMGCKFAPRCARCMSRCRAERPVMFATDVGKVRCFLYDAQRA